jgi:hypothetical protein
MKELTENQKWYYQKVMKLGKNKAVKEMSYDELFLVLDRIKFAYFLDFAMNDTKTRGVIKRRLK